MCVRSHVYRVEVQQRVVGRTEMSLNVIPLLKEVFWNCCATSLGLRPREQGHCPVQPAPELYNIKAASPGAMSVVGGQSQFVKALVLIYVFSLVLYGGAVSLTDDEYLEIWDRLKVKQESLLQRGGRRYQR
jgi:hypothetical protein